MKTVLLLDVETDGLDDSAKCIEVAVALFDLEHAAITRSYSTLIQATSNAAQALNGIDPALLANATSTQAAWSAVSRFAERADVVVAHNASFDRRFVPANTTGTLRWICTMSDVIWPRQTRVCDSLIGLALAHGVGVASAHRAFSDVDLLARLLNRCKDLGSDIEAMLARGLRPKAGFEAIVPFERKDEAKDAGFKWNEAGDRRWTRIMAIEDALQLPFEVRQITEVI